MPLMNPPTIREAASGMPSNIVNPSQLLGVRADDAEASTHAPTESPASRDECPAIAPANADLPPTVDLTPEGPARGIEDVARAFEEFRARTRSADPALVESWCLSLQANDAVLAFQEVHRSSPLEATRLARAAAEMPRAGQEWLGFRLLEELGRGAFGRVFLARQENLANRLVALKVSTDLFSETQTLALLQHTNIVPIYSAYRSGPLQAVCMPYFGATTLADLIRALGATPTLPSSGKMVVGTLSQRREPGSHATATSQQPNPPSTGVAVSTFVAEAPSHEPGGDVPHPEAVLDTLKRLSYVEAVLWIGARLAEGLAHAHERGVVHRDLKPANVLLTDEGQPMLLDFNLSDNASLRGAAVARLGGTLPYMAPENLAALRGGPVPAIDPRGDLYSLGVILFELLTAHHPFPTPRLAPDELVPRMIRDRQTVPLVRHWNSRVSAAAESIVRRCLEPNPDRRYQSAAQLVEDLERQRANLPLRHAPEPSTRERAAKWLRRHQRLAAAMLVAIAVFAALVVPAAWYAGREGRLHRAAHETRKQFVADRLVAERILNRPVPGRTDLTDGVRAARAAIDRYDVLKGPSWQEAALVQRLPENERAELKEEVGDLLLMLARATVIQADDDREHQDELARTALAFNVRAEQDCMGQPFSRAGWLQRADLARRLGEKELEVSARQRATQTPPRTARDHLLLARELMGTREFKEALPHLRVATDLDSHLFWAWYCQGACHFEMRQDIEALQCYRAGLAIWPETYELRLGRGLVYQRQARWDEAIADLDVAVRLRPEEPETYVHRASLKLEMHHPKDALEDLDRALKMDNRLTRAWFLSAMARRRLDDAEGAKRDFAEGMRIEPADAEGWYERGRARLESDPKGSLTDLDRALQLNPRFLPAMQSKGYILADVLKKNAEALVVMDRVVALYPDYTPARLGRGVLRARLGQLYEAREDARACLDQSNEATTLYQTSNIYSLTSTRVEGDRQKALSLLTAALRAGFGLAMVENDPDFIPLRNDPEFRKCVEAARTLRSNWGKQTR
jgi:eukaryotic-like serine/threonine-protein kinase